MAGFTLVEVVVSIVIIGVAVAGVLSVMNLSTQHSADPMVQEQAVAIAEAYLEEILLKEYTDPGGPAETRATFDNVADYNGLTNAGARDKNDNAIAGLGSYTVSVTVTDIGITIGPVGNTANAALITVNVTHPAGVNISLSGYRTP